MSKLYAAYASGLNSKQMALRCQTAKATAKSWLFDHRLVFKGRHDGAHATVEPEEGQAVPVLVWEISDQDEAALDGYHCVSEGYYTKEYVPLEVAGEIREVLIYTMRPCDYGLPTKKYLDTVTRGYLEWNFPMTTLEEAVAHSYNGSIVYLNSSKEEFKNALQPEY